MRSARATSAQWTCSKRSCAASPTSTRSSGRSARPSASARSPTPPRSTSAAQPANHSAPSPACRSPSRTTCSSPGRTSRPAAACCRRSPLPSPLHRSNVSRMRTACSSAGPIWMSSAWAARPKRPSTSGRTTRSATSSCPAAAAAAAPPRSRPTCARWRSAAIPAVRYDSPPPFAASPASSPPTDASRATG